MALTLVTVRLHHFNKSAKVLGSAEAVISSVRTLSCNVLRVMAATGEGRAAEWETDLEWNGQNRHQVAKVLGRM